MNSQSDNTHQLLDEAELRQKLAAIEHERWADWQAWCHKILRENLRYDDMGTNLEEILERWEKQIATPYDQLSESEKASDMEQVDRYWPLFQSQLAAARIEMKRSVSLSIFHKVRAKGINQESTEHIKKWAEQRIAELQSQADTNQSHQGEKTQK